MRVTGVLLSRADWNKSDLFVALMAGYSFLSYRIVRIEKILLSKARTR
jgi:hypothetical protein